MTANRTFAPNVTDGEPIGRVNAYFLLDAERWRLRYLCQDCANVRRDGSCAMGWPNDRLRQQPFAAVDPKGTPQFCKSFEPDEG